MRKAREVVGMGIIFCCGCGSEVQARLTDGLECYPHRSDLATLNFWKCDTCGNFVGCHNKSSSPTKPLGCIPTPEIKAARKRIHAVIDPLWQTGKLTREELYAKLSMVVGRQYHTAELRSVEECEFVLKWAGRMYG